MATIFALSSGAPPAGIAVIRISGEAAGTALLALARRVPPARRASRAWLKAADGTLLDDGLMMFFPGPHTATGEDLAELHLHGGRAVVAAVEDELSSLPGLRKAEPGEFTRRAFANGRIDLAEAEGLADLLSAETELQRRSAILNAGGHLSRKIETWRSALLTLSAQVEAALDFSEEDDVSTLPQEFTTDLARLAGDLDSALSSPSAEPLREGFRVALAGPPNAGKSTLFNALLDREEAITAPLAGTTRDVLTRSVAMGGVPFTLVDMAGLRDDSDDMIEQIGIARAGQEIEKADLVLWLGEVGEGPAGSWEIDAQCDRPDHQTKHSARFSISAVTGAGMVDLKNAMISHARQCLPKPGELALNHRQRALLDRARHDMIAAQKVDDWLIVGEHLRLARAAFDALVGHTATDDVLDALFGRFCIGK